MGSLAPLGMSLLMTVTTILGRGKALGRDELSIVGRRIGGKKRLIGSEAIVIVLAGVMRIERSLHG